MHARIGIVQTSPEDFEQALRIIETQALPSLRLMDGFRGKLLLADRTGSKAWFVTFWDSEDAMRRSEKDVAVLREDTAAVLGLGEIPVERYEVLALELSE